MGDFPEKILLATDGSEDAARATDVASDLAKRAGSELHVVHVWHDVPGFAHDFVKRELKRQGQEVLDAQVEKIAGTGATVAKAHLREGRTSNEVIALSEEIAAGLLVVGSRGLGTVQRILMGSQSEEIVHHAHLPVLVLRGEDDVWPPQRLVIGEDFSDGSRQAGDLAANIGGLYGARATLIFAHPDLPELPPGETPDAVQAVLDMRGRDEDRLNERAAELEGVLRTRPQTHVSNSYPAVALLEAAQDNDRPTLIAVGSRGIAGLSRTRLGSVSTKAVTASHGPVLVCPK